MSQAENVNTDFLPIIYDVIRSIEKETFENTQKPQEAVESNLKIPEFRTKLQQCREQIQKLPGVDYTKEDQICRLDALREQLVQKRQLLLKYKRIYNSDTINSEFDMYFIKTVTRCGSTLNYLIKSARLFCSNVKNFDKYFRCNADYKNLVVPLDQNLNEYKVSVSLELQSVETEVFFNNLTQRGNVMKLTPLQVKDILGLMATKSVDTLKYDLPLKFLDEKCALSAERLPLDLSFYLLDTWYIILGSKAFRKHYYSAITSQWSKKIKKCSKSNLILILYFIGLSKSAQPFLMESVVDRMESLISEFTDEEIAVACLSLFKCSKPINFTLFLKRSCISAENLLRKNDRFNAINILKCLRLSKYYDEKIWDAVKHYAIKENGAFNIVECTNFLAFFASESNYNELLFKSLETQTVKLLRKELESDVSEKSIKTHPSLRSRVKDFARFLWALTTLGHHVKEDTMTCLTECVEKRWKLGEYDMQLHILIDTLQSFVLANYYPEKIFSLVLTSYTYKRIYNSDRAKPKYQLYFVEMSLAIERPKISIHKTHLTNPIPKHLNKEIEVRKGFKELIKVLDQQFPGSYKSCYLIPHIMVAGIFLTKPCNSSDALSIYNRYISDGIITKQVQHMFKRNQDYFCIEILDPSVCVNESRQPLGLMQAKIRQLKKLNFQVIALYSDDIDIIIQKSSQNNFNINDIIFEKIV